MPLSTQVYTFTFTLQLCGVYLANLVLVANPQDYVYCQIKNFSLLIRT